MKGIDPLNHEAPTTNSKQGAAQIRHFHEALEDRAKPLHAFVITMQA